VNGFCEGKGLREPCNASSECESNYCNVGGFCAPESTNQGAGESSGSSDDEADDGSADLAEIEFILIAGGIFQMGSDEYESEQPIHEVTVPSFEMMRTEVTQAQYKVCFDAGVCPPPGAEFANNRWWNLTSELDHPVDTVTWDDAKTFAEFVGARLPSEAEWEYAARSGGQDIMYPWGNDEPDCGRSNQRCGNGIAGSNAATSVCRYLSGNTTQGLCDMAGNVSEWVEDYYHDNYIDPPYTGAPNDGSAWIIPQTRKRVARGGAFNDHPDVARATLRKRHDPSDDSPVRGFRLARDVP
jgi:formylglycine-generating enzyme required for sulfatase activity